MRPHDTDLTPPASGLNRRKALILAAAATTIVATPGVSAAKTAQELSDSSRHALNRLYAVQPTMRMFGKGAKAILVFPEITKAGLVVGGQSGEGALLVNDKVTGFFRSSGGSIGLQAGAQTFSYVLFLMSQKAIDYLKNNNGWSIGTGPEVVVLDAGAAKAMTTTTMRSDVYAVVFGQKGVMGGITIDGSKISRIHPKAS